MPNAQSDNPVRYDIESIAIAIGDKIYNVESKARKKNFNTKVGLTLCQVYDICAQRNRFITYKGYKTDVLRKARILRDKLRENGIHVPANNDDIDELEGIKHDAE